MRINKIDQKNNYLNVCPENIDDLWHLEKIIEVGDTIVGSSDRKLKPKNEGDKAQRIKIFVELQVESVHFQEYSENLKVNGIILAGKPEEFVELKSHHSLELIVGENVSIRKQKIKKWQIERLKKAEKASASNELLIVLLDDEESEMVFANQFSMEKKAKLLSGKQGKLYAEEKTNYFQEIFDKIIALKPKKVIVAGPGFTKTNFQKFFEEKKSKGAPQLIVESTNSIGQTGFNELLKSGKLEKVEKQLELAKDSVLIEEFLEKLAKGLGEYGFDEVMGAVLIGAADKVLVAESFLMQERKKAEELIEKAESSGTLVRIISTRNPEEKQIHGFGGTVAILRYKLKE